MMADENKNVLLKARFQIEYPECPHCASDQATRISPAVLPDDRYDDEESGVYRCGHCRNEYQFLKLIVEQEFAPTAQCPKCGSYKTKTFSVHNVRRYHLCEEPNCKKSFRTVRPPTERRSRRAERN